MLEWLDITLQHINASPIPEWTGAVLAKSVRFFIDVVAPLINEYVIVIFG